eukprot:scaffold8859_cov135-Isochrysis_galbana.AAC.2
MSAPCRCSRAASRLSCIGTARSCTPRRALRSSDRRVQRVLTPPQSRADRRQPRPGDAAMRPPARDGGSGLETGSRSEHMCKCPEVTRIGRRGPWRLVVSQPHLRFILRP